MAATAFVLFWVVLGLSLLFIALRGGPRGAARGGRRPTRRGGGLGFVAFVLAVLVLGAGVPAAVIATVDERDDIPEANVSNLTPLQQRGRELFGGNQAQCKNCHTLAAANAIAQVGPNLDQLRPPYGLVMDAIQNGRARGNGAMAANLVQGEDAKAVAAFVAAAVGQEVPADAAR